MRLAGLSGAIDKARAAQALGMLDDPENVDNVASLLPLLVKATHSSKVGLA